MKIYRVRVISCDGGKPGREWQVFLFLNLVDASRKLHELIDESDKRNPKYPFEKTPENLDKISGYCNWQFGTMITLDSLEVN